MFDKEVNLNFMQQAEKSQYDKHIEAIGKQLHYCRSCLTKQCSMCPAHRRMQDSLQQMSSVEQLRAEHIAHEIKVAKEEQDRRIKQRLKDNKGTGIFCIIAMIIFGWMLWIGFGELIGTDPVLVPIAVASFLLIGYGIKLGIDIAR